MQTDALRAIANARIPGLLVRGLVETGTARMITAFEAVPIRIGCDASNNLTVSFRAIPSSAPPEVYRYLDLAVRDCGFEAQRSDDGSVWISYQVRRRLRLIEEAKEICRLARQIADGANWLTTDQLARTVWASNARPVVHSKKGDDPK